jgi:hypothetical protein
MKKTTPVFLLLLVLSFVGNAQKGNNQISIGPEVDLPIGSFNDIYKVGFGGTIKGLLGVGTAGQVTLMTGFSSFKGKSSGAGGFDFSSQTFNIIPILLGYRQNFSGFYAEPLAGLAIYKTKVTGFSESETRFTYGIGAGYAQKAVDLGLRWQSHEGATLLALRIAYALSLKK